MGSRIETIFQPRFQKTCDSPKAPTADRVIRTLATNLKGLHRHHAVLGEV